MTRSTAELSGASIPARWPRGGDFFEGGGLQKVAKVAKVGAPAGLPPSRGLTPSPRLPPSPEAMEDKSVRKTA